MHLAALAAEMTMPVYSRRVRATSQTYAVTVICSERMRIFQREANASLMVATLYRYRAGGRFLLHGFVVMPNHIHVIFTPTAALEQAVGLIKGGLSFAVREQYRGPVWQEGYYSHRVMHEQDYESQLAYIAANPARRGLENYAFVHTQHGYELDPVPAHLGG
jgi:putative transposase